MLNLEFIQKLVLQTGEVSKHGLLLPIPHFILYLMIPMSIYYILLGEKRERLVATIIMSTLGFFYVGGSNLKLAYGVEAVTNAFYTPIIKAPLSTVSFVLYILFIYLGIVGFRKLRQHSKDTTS